VPNWEIQPPQMNSYSGFFKAAARAPDHRNLKPWRFVVIEGEGLKALGELYQSAMLKTNPELPEDKKQRALVLPQRAPMVIVAIATIAEDPKVPEIEQVLSTGAAVQNMLNAAFAMGLGAIWRTGDLAFNPYVAEGLGLDQTEQIIGFIYLGTPKVPFRKVPEVDLESFVSRWP
jgi:Nitroreductase